MNEKKNFSLQNHHFSIGFFFFFFEFACCCVIQSFVFLLNDYKFIFFDFLLLNISTLLKKNVVDLLNIDCIIFELVGFEYYFEENKECFGWDK